MEPVFKIEDGEVIVYRGNGRSGSLGTLCPNDEQLVRVLKRAYALGQSDKAAEIRVAIGAGNV